MWDQFQRQLFGTTPRLLRTIFVAVVAVHLLYFMVLPWFLTRRKTHGRTLRRYLEWVVATPSLLGDVIRIEARHNLMRFAHMEGRYNQVADQGFAILKHKHLPSSLAAEVRGRLADALEGLGRFAEAKEQRSLAESSMKDAPRDASWYVNRGRQLAAKRDFAGACEAYEEGLAVVREGANDGRVLLTLHLSNALFMAGRLEDSARRAEEAAGMVHDTERLLSAHRQAGAAYSDLGRLDLAEAHKQRVVEITEPLGDAKRSADSLAELAEVKRKRGRLAEALAACDRAAAASRPTRQLEMVRYQTLRSWGRFDEALAALKSASQLDPNVTPRAEATMQGVITFARASTLLEQARIEGVASLLDTARGKVRGDAKLTLWCDAAALRLAALEGDRALDSFEDIEQRLTEFAQDANTRAGVLGNLGRAALDLGDYQRALDYWMQVRNLPPQPVDSPIAHYYLGEAHRGLGDDLSARSCYRDALATGLDTHYTRLAQSRLRTIVA
jgi:tetratricopeptide (TPR) repeat protein